jgi:hypothetical protein
MRPSRLILLAAAGAALFFWRVNHLWPLVPLGKGIAPASQIAPAVGFLAREGYDVSAHRSAAEVDLDDEALDHADSLLGRPAALALAPRTWVAGTFVTFKRRGDPDVVVAWVATDGRVSKWFRSYQDDASAGATDSAGAAALARAGLARVELDSAPPVWAMTGTSVRERPKRVDRTFTFERRWSVNPELKERAQVTVAGNRLAGVIRNLVVPDDARRARLAAAAPTQSLQAVGFLLVAAAIVAAFVQLLRALRDGSARIGAPGVVAAVVFAGVIATFFLEPAFLVNQWQPLWPFATAPLTALQGIGIRNAWLALVLYIVVAAGDAADRTAGTNRGASLWLALRLQWRDRTVGRAAWQGWLVGLVCGGVLAGTMTMLQWLTGGAPALQPRGFFVKVLNAWSPSLTALLFFTSVALAEELGYRFFAGTWLERLTGRRWVAIWAPALVYGLSHTGLDFLPSAGPFWTRPLALTLVGAAWGWAFFRFDALTVVLSHLTADLFIFNWPRLATAEWHTAGPAALVVLAPLVPAVLAAVAPRGAPPPVPARA